MMDTQHTLTEAVVFGMGVPQNFRLEVLRKYRNCSDGATGPSFAPSGSEPNTIFEEEYIS